MPTVLHALAVTLAIAACDGPTEFGSFRSTIDDGAVPEELRAAYRDDAARLALRDLIAGGGSRDITIPERLVRPYYHALVLVHNAAGLPARDTVVDVYGIHTFPWPTTRSLMLILAPGPAWVGRLVRGELPTGEPAVDDLLETYDLSLSGYFALSNGDWLVTLEPAEPLNIAALATRFTPIAGVKSSSPNGAVGGGNDIQASRASTSIRLEYSVGYGDCPAGCISRRSYRFAVDVEGTVEYLGASGDPPPPPPPR